MSFEHKETLTNEEKARLDGLKNRFNLVPCADFQMCKWVPTGACQHNQDICTIYKSLIMIFLVQ